MYVSENNLRLLIAQKLRVRCFLFRGFYSTVKIYIYAGSLDGVSGARSLEGGVRHGEETKD